MKRAIYSIIIVYSLIVLGGIFYTVFMARTLPENLTIAIPFAFIRVTGLGLFAASLVLGIIFFRHLKYIWPILVPVFLITSLLPFWFIHNSYVNRPVKVPPPGPLPVSISQYNSDIKLVLDDYLEYELDSNSIDIYQDTIISTQIDTIFYSPGNIKFFAIIIAVAKDFGKLKYCTKYRVGSLLNSNWQLGEPKGNINSLCLKSIPELKATLRQYYYKKYSINGSSEKPEIWNDEYIFNFENKREKYIDRRNNSL